MLLNNAIYEAAVIAAAEKDRRNLGVHPSETECTRRVTFCLLDAPKKTAKITVKQQLLLDQAKAIHAMIQTELEVGIGDIIPGARFQAEVEISPETHPLAREFLITGHADGVTYLPDGDEVLEIKTVRDEEVVKALQGVKLPHLRQANIYMYCLDVHKVTFMYVARADPNARRFFPAVFDKLLWEATAANIRLAIESSVEGRLPPVATDSYTCRLCPYSHLCVKKEKWVDADYLATRK